MDSPFMLISLFWKLWRCIWAPSPLIGQDYISWHCASLRMPPIRHQSFLPLYLSRNRPDCLLYSDHPISTNHQSAGSGMTYCLTALLGTYRAFLANDSIVFLEHLHLSAKTLHARGRHYLTLGHIATGYLSQDAEVGAILTISKESCWDSCSITSITTVP